MGVACGHMSCAVEDPSKHLPLCGATENLQQRLLMKGRVESATSCSATARGGVLEPSEEPPDCGAGDPGSGHVTRVVRRPHVTEASLLVLLEQLGDAPWWWTRVRVSLS